MLLNKFKAVFHPENFHGWNKTKRYFEIWNYKLLSFDKKSIISIIPGMSIDQNGKKQAFIQIINGISLESEYYPFDADTFQAHPKKFELKIGENFFSDSKIQLLHPELKAKLSFNEHIRWPSNSFSPGVMGPFSFLPFLECYHGVLSLDHEIEGEISFLGKTYDFNGGRGYIEKDWGHSFPSSYIWMQCNHFSKKEISFITSIAKVPFTGSYFRGFFAAIWFQEKLVQFNNYNFSKIVKCENSNEHLILELENKDYKLRVEGLAGDTVPFSSPVLGFMDGRINKSLTSKLELSLFDKRKKTIVFKDIGEPAGLETSGDLTEMCD